MAKRKFTFVIPISWQETGELVISAESLEDAVLEVENMELPKGEYIDGSWEVNRECIEDYPRNRISTELAKIEGTPMKDLPLLIGTLKTSVANKYLEKKIKGEKTNG